jgi:CheY-like chemotaxis protein
MSRTIEADFLPSPVEEAKEKPRILIVDNSRDFTYSAKLALERTGRYAVWEENEPARAHQTAQRVKPDLILLDIVMPETDGGEVAARIESDPTLQGTPIVFLTALVTKAEARSGLQIQGHPFLAKPINIPKLVVGIERNLPMPINQANNGYSSLVRIGAQVNERHEIAIDSCFHARR